MLYEVITNFLDGARVIIKPGRGLKIKGVYGYQRQAFLEGQIVHGKGLVRGLDAEWNINSFKESWKNKKLNVTIGASFVSKYQKDDREDLILPENVGAYGVITSYSIHYTKLYDMIFYLCA